MSTPFNSLATYAEAGRTAGTASKRKDTSLVAEQQRWLSSALRLETPAYAREARETYTAAYKAKSGFSDKPNYFR